MRDSGFASTGPNFAKSTCGQGSRLSAPPPVTAPPAAGARRAGQRRLTKRLHVLLQDAALRPGARDAREVDAELARELAHRRRRVRAP